MPDQKCKMQLRHLDNTDGYSQGRRNFVHAQYRLVCAVELVELGVVHRLLSSISEQRCASDSGHQADNRE